MHAFSIMSSVVQALLSEIEKLEKEGKKIEKVNEVLLEIGELTFLGSEQLEFCYNVLTEENALKGSKLVIQTVRAEVQCNTCDYRGKIEYFREFHLETPVLQCPECKNIVEIIKGRECAVRSMNLEMEDES